MNMMSDKVTMETVSAQHLQACASVNLLSGNGTLSITTHTHVNMSTASAILTDGLKEAEDIMGAQ